MVCESTNLEDYPDLVFEVEDIERNKFELILSGQDYIDRCYYSWISLKCKLKFE